jgi:hypothetical protein
MNSKHNRCDVTTASIRSTLSADFLDLLGSLEPDDAPLSPVAALEKRLLDCIGSEDYVAVIRELVAARDPEAIRVLASLLDSVGGPIIEESIAGLLSFGEAVIPAMRECVDSLDYDMIRHGHQVLAELGDEASHQWLRDDEAERIAAYLERQGVDPEAWAELAIEAIANEADEPGESA